MRQIFNFATSCKACVGVVSVWSPWPVATSRSYVVLASRQFRRGFLIASTPCSAVAGRLNEAYVKATLSARSHLRLLFLRAAIFEKNAVLQGL